MNILIVVDDFSGGAGNIAQLLALELHGQGQCVSMLMTNLHSTQRYTMDLVKILDAHWLSMRGNWLSIQRHRIREIRQVVQDTECDIVISFLDNNNTLVCLALWRKNLPVIVSERSNPLVISPKFPWNYLRRLAYHRADMIAVQFEAFRDFDGKRFASKCIEIPNIVEVAPSTKQNYETKKIRFISLGRNHKIKRFPLMIKLFSEVVASVPDAELHIYGTNVNCSALRECIRTCGTEGSVFLHDAVSAVHEELLRHDVYLMTSEQEGFPNALSEAMACGLPIVAIKCHEGIGTLVRHGENGFCVAEGDWDGLIRGMIALCESAALRQHFGTESVSIAKRYNRERVMQIWNDSIQKTMGKYEKE